MNMIPHIIHYCWFGRNSLPEEAKKCINSWKKYLPGYEIKEWNEDNFDIHICPYVEEAYKTKKWAFVSDYARFWILYNYGGLYFDTDVEIIRPIDQIVSSGPFMGIEAGNNLVAPGLGLGAISGMPIYSEILKFYDKAHFLNPDGTQNEMTVVMYVSDILRKHGWNETKANEITKVDGLSIYPEDYFCPQNYLTGEIKITNNTVSIHHYSMSWKSSLDRIIKKIETCKAKKGIKYNIRRCVSFPFRIVSKIQKLGFKNTIIFSFSKINRKHI